MLNKIYDWKKYSSFKILEKLGEALLYYLARGSK